MSAHALKNQDNSSPLLFHSIDQYFAKITNFNLEYIPVALELFLNCTEPGLHTYLPEPDSTFKTFTSNKEPLSDAKILSLQAKGVKSLYIHRTSVPRFTQYIEKTLHSLPFESTLFDEQKVSVLRKSALKVMADIYAEPTKENIARGIQAVSGFVYLLMKDPKAYMFLNNLSSHDPYTLQHSVGVATQTILIAKKSGINAESSLIEAGVGGLLHDIGKTKVPNEIINKKGPLDESEWAIMKQHALFGYEIIRDNPDIGTHAKLAILQHHEEPSGNGYPLHLAAAATSQLAKIVTLADIFNALTTNRSYSAAQAPFEAFQTIKDKISHKIDFNLFEILVRIYGSKIS